MFVNYLRSSNDGLPGVDSEAEDAVMRVVAHQGFSPRDIIRVYVAALREIAMERNTRQGSVTRPMVLLAHVLARLVELGQMDAATEYEAVPTA